MISLLCVLKYNPLLIKPNYDTIIFKYTLFFFINILVQINNQWKIIKINIISYIKIVDQITSLRKNYIMNIKVIIKSSNTRLMKQSKSTF